VDLAHGGHIARDPDEGAIAHLFQLLMTVQWPITLFFVVKWLRRAPRQTLRVLGLQAAAWLAGARRYISCIYKRGNFSWPGEGGKPLRV